MNFTGEEYFRAAIDRMRQAREIHDNGKGYALAMYCSGLAVECMLRAFRWQEDPSFEGRHDLRDLFKASRLLRIDEDQARSQGTSEEEITQSATKLRAAISEIAILWHNNRSLRVGVEFEGALEPYRPPPGHPRRRTQEEFPRPARCGKDHLRSRSCSVDLKEKIEKALRSRFQIDHIQLVDEDGVYGFVVSPDFRGLSAIDRQTRVDQALRDPSMHLTRPEQRQILAIAPLTPAEFQVIGPVGVGPAD